MVLACAFTAIAGTAAVLAATHRDSWIWALSDGQADGRSANLQDVTVGAIVLQTDDQRCQRMTFDNSTGRALDAFKPCEKPELLDANGVPVPTGTMHRLDAISKSFAGKSQ
jgi:hypothetical protein